MSAVPQPYQLGDAVLVAVNEGGDRSLPLVRQVGVRIDVTVRRPLWLMMTMRSRWFRGLGVRLPEAVKARFEGLSLSEALRMQADVERDLAMAFRKDYVRLGVTLDAVRLEGLSS